MNQSLRTRKATRGFTLVELMVAMAVAATLMAGVYQFFIAQQRSYSSQDEVNRVQQNARMAETLIAKAIQLTGSFLPDPLNAATISMRGQSILAATDRYIVLQYDDPLNTADLHVVAADEVVAFVVSKTVPTAGTAGGTEAIDVAVHFDKNADGTLTAADAHDFQISLDLGSPPYTLYRVTPTIAGGIVAEAIAPNVDNFVLRYYGRDGQPVVLDTSGVEALATAPLNATDRWSVRSVEVELVLRTANEDPNLAASAWTDFAAGSAVARDTAGAIDAGFVGFTDSHRRRKFSSRITPRSLAIGNCGRLELAASDPAPNCPDNTTVTATVIDQLGAVASGVTVDFSTTDGTLSAPSGTTSAAGQAQVDLAYTGLAKPVMVSAKADVSCTQDGVTQTVTLHNSFVVNFQPGPWDYVLLGDLAGTPINTCDDSTFTFTAKSYDQCDNEVPPELGLFFEAPLTTGTGNGQITGDDPAPALPWGTVQAEMTSSGQTFTVASPDSGPLGTSASYSMVVQETAGSTLPLNVTGNMDLTGIASDLHPWPPESISFLSGNILAATHEDCPSSDVTDTFNVLDCLDNPIHTLGSGYQVDARIDPDGSVVDPTDHGTIFSTLAGVPAPALPGTPAATSLTITASSGGVFDTGYHPPACTLGPPSGSVVNPTVTLDLTDGASTLDTESGPLTLEACADCVVQFLQNPTPCVQQIPVQISGCTFDPNSTVELEVTWSGAGSATFDATGTTTQTLTLSGAPPHSVTADLNIENQVGGDTYTVTAYYPNKLNQRWSCSETATVGSDCTNLKMYAVEEAAVCPFGSTDLGLSPNTAGYRLCLSDLTASGADNCLANTLELYFEVDDCQAFQTNIPGGISVWVDVNGTEYDREYVDLTLSPPDRFEMDDYRSQSGRSTLGGLPLGPSTHRISGDHFLAYPVSQDITIYAEYTDPVDATDTCRESSPFIGPIPVCFPNAITSGGGGTWDGNFDIHWGDVVIMGNVEVPAQYTLKDQTTTFNTNKEDRFFDIYVGKASPGDTGSGNFLDHGADVCEQTTDLLDRPFIPGGTASSMASPGLMYGNYFCNISNARILGMIRRLDYTTMKTLAKGRGAYWYTLPNGNVYNPAPGPWVTVPLDPVVGVPLEEVLNLLPTGGSSNGLHNGELLFIDTYFDPAAPAQIDGYSGTDIDNMCVDDPMAGTDCSTLPNGNKLPEHVVVGAIYTSGIIYVAGTLDWDGVGGGMDLDGTSLARAETPPVEELHYEDNVALAVQSTPAWNPTEGDLPIRPNPALDSTFVTLNNIHINGAIYLDGSLDGAGNPAIYGAITAERGFKGGGSPIVFYNYNLNVSGENSSLCVTCCQIVMDPGSATLFPGGSVNLSTPGAVGTPYWWSGNTAVADVDQNGRVTANDLGQVRISAADENNCVASAEIFVVDSCAVFKEDLNLSPPTPVTIAPGSVENFSVLFTPPAVSVGWSSSNTTAATIDASGQATGVCPGTTVIAANDTSGTCPVGPQAIVTVQASSCTLNLSNTAVTLGVVGDTATVDAFNSVCDVTWSSSDSTIASVIPGPSATTTITGFGTGIVTVTATDEANCTATATVGVGCGAITVTHAPADIQLIPGTSYTLTAGGGTGPYGWAVGAASTGTGILAGNILTPADAGTLVVDVTDSLGCTRSTTFTVACVPPTVATDSPADGSSYGIATLNGPNLTWEAIPNDQNGADPLDQIASVAFEIFDSAGASVYSTTESIPLYCGFGGNVCPSTDVGTFTNDTYTFTATATTTAAHPCGVTSVSDSISLDICNIYMVDATTGNTVTSPLQLLKGDVVDLNPANAVGVVSWTSSDAAVFTVDPGGTITTKNVPSDQSAILTLTDQTGCSTSITVEVYKTALPPP